MLYLKVFDDAVKTGCSSTFPVVPDQTATVPPGECLTPSVAAGTVDKDWGRGLPLHNNDVEVMT